MSRTFAIRGTSLAVVASLILGGSLATARESPYAVDAERDAAAIALGAAVWLGGELVKSELPGPVCDVVCDPLGVNPLDRTSIGWHSREAALASDWLLAITLTLPVAVGGLDVALSNSQREYAPDVVVYAEAIAVTGALTEIVKFAVRRPRPLTYDPTIDPRVRAMADAGSSFFSGHTSLAFAAAVTFARGFDHRHADSVWRAPVWIIGLSLASTTGVMRVLAGKHFWTDVLVGAIAGTAGGLLVTSLHVADEPHSTRETLGRPRATTVFSFGGAF